MGCTNAKATKQQSQPAATLLKNEGKVVHYVQRATLKAGASSELVVAALEEGETLQKLAKVDGLLAFELFEGSNESEVVAYLKCSGDKETLEVAVSQLNHALTSAAAHFEAVQSFSAYGGDIMPQGRTLFFHGTDARAFV
eukprot:TRINITY_DN19315_c0_g1_i1.p2 TRINITY_DN19315_c0_g1~~TRINITY_DN19315_c0_g1_i1.p2  ORF type:complete len:140 (+),score=42.56 TRINITY_DN19315_c0_g1_i1:80-499(+)